LWSESLVVVGNLQGRPVLDRVKVALAALGACGDLDPVCAPGGVGGDLDDGVITREKTC
jgi:hypothetical protein